MTIQMTLIGGDLILKSFVTFQDRFQKDVATAYTASTLEAATFSKKITPVKTGYLRSRTKADPTIVSKQVILTSFSNDTPYGPFVCFGTKYMKGRDFMTPAMMFGADRLVERLQKIRF